jgi:hypothetical protein
MINFEPLYLFLNENITLFEVKRNDLPADSSPDKLYYWLTVSKTKPEIRRLTFQKMTVEKIDGNDINVRTFTEGELRFDKNFAKFILDDNGHIIMNAPITDFPENLVTLTKNYFSSIL